MMFYHATDYTNLGSIIKRGIEPRGVENSIYLCKTPEDSAKFLAIRGIKNIISLAIDLNPSEVEESFDHNFNVFKCKAYTYNEVIPFNKINLDKSRQFKL